MTARKPAHSRKFWLVPLLAGLLAASVPPQLQAEPASVTERQKVLQEAARVRRHHGVWASATDQELKDDRAGLQQEATIKSRTLGYDYLVTTSLTIGLALTQQTQRSELLQDDTQRSGDGQIASLYGTYAPYPFLNFPVSIGWGKYKTSQERVTEGQELEGDFTAKLITASAGMSLLIPLQPVFLNSGLQLSYASSRIDSFIERWPGQQVETPAQTTSSTQLHLFTKARLWANGILWPYLSLKYSRDLQRKPHDDDVDQLQWGIGLDLLHADGWYGGLGYSRVVGRQGIDDRSLTLSLRKSF
jgi:uncharacterized protein YhjY with autotransporter beta-barrel domain